MPLSSRYLIRETGGNLRRNLLMTIAAVLTMVVSLAALGGVLIMRQAINTQSVQFRGGVQLAVFLDPTIAPSESKAIGQVLATTPGVKSYHYVDKVEALAEFRQLFHAEPALLSVMSLDHIPASYRVVPDRSNDTAELGTLLQKQPGVYQVSYAKAEIDALQSRFRVLKYIAVALAVGVMIGAIALIINTIQLAIFARRREVAVMKLVGATNWFIRIPFMLEGLVHGVVGAILAFVIVFFARDTIASFVGSESLLQGAKPYATPHEAIMTGIVILVLGAAVGALGSAFAVRRFLQV